MATFVLDTNVILAEGKKAFYAFEKNDVVVPYQVLKELESKRTHPELGFYAREALKDIAALKDANDGDVSVGVSLGDGFGELRVEMNHVSTSELPERLLERIDNDTRILAVAHNLKTAGEDVTLVTRDVPLQILANIAGVKTDSLSEPSKADVDQYIHDVPEFEVAPEVIDELYANKVVQLSEKEIDVPANTGVLLKAYNNSALAVAGPSWQFYLVKNNPIKGIDTKGREQAIAAHHLMNNDLGIVSLGGRAGSGKSMLALAAALQIVGDNRNSINKVVVFRPMNAVGGSEQELGFLPGTLEEKLDPIAQPVFDTLATFMNPIDIKKIKDDKKIEFRSIAHARGSTLTNSIVIVDEVQNLSKSTIGTLLTRAGANSRIFLSWDINQIDAKYTGKFDGIFRVVRFLMGKKLFAHVSLKKSQRSPVAELAAGILEEL
jgi:PhoH-like ATPase